MQKTIKMIFNSVKIFEVPFLFNITVHGFKCKISRIHPEKLQTESFSGGMTCPIREGSYWQGLALKSTGSYGKLVNNSGHSMDVAIVAGLS